MVGEQYLAEGRFTIMDDSCRRAASQIKGRYPIEGIHEFVRSLPMENRPDLRRKRTAGKIIEDGFLTGCTDAGLVFVTLSRIKGIPTVYVETVKEEFFLNPVGTVLGHVFADTYENGVVAAHNPGHGRTEKVGERYFWICGQSLPVYVEIGRGLDFSQLYTKGRKEPLELISTEQIRALIRELNPA